MPLFVVSTPIGNLQDITRNALKVLESSSLILCENTITTNNLLSHFGILGKKTVNYTDHTGEDAILRHLNFAFSNPVSLVSEAGTPVISDPGYKLIKKAHEMGVQIHSIPGASSLVSAISVCGLPSYNFAFLGFYEKSKQEKIDFLLKNKITVALFLPARDILKILEDLNLSENQISIVRELTKVFEDIKTGSIKDLISYYQVQNKLKGEAVLIIAPSHNAQNNADIKREIATILAKKPFLRELKIKELSEVLKAYEATMTYFSKKEIYNALISK